MTTTPRETTGGTFRIFTFKDGLLSKIAHDLQISAPEFRVTVEGEALHAEVALNTLVVDGAVKAGRLCPDTLSAKDKREILQNLARDVLELSRYPRARFEGAAAEQGDGSLSVSGALELHGQRRPLCFGLQRVDERLCGRFSLRPSAWGIKPFKALMGALKVQDRVDVALDLDPLSAP